MKITYEGFYGFKNAGDDAFVEVSSWGAQKYWSCTNNVFIGAHLPKTVHAIKAKPSKGKGLDRVSFFQLALIFNKVLKGLPILLIQTPCSATISNE